jgi:hypothetical protein
VWLAQRDVFAIDINTRKKYPEEARSYPKGDTKRLYMTRKDAKNTIYIALFGF